MPIAINGAGTITGITAGGLPDDTVDGGTLAMGSDAAGDVLTYNGTDYIRLAKGTAEQVLKMNAGANAVEWATDAGGIAIPGSSVVGDTLYHNGSIYTRLAKGTAAQVLTMNAGATAPEWAAAGSPAYVQFPGTQTQSTNVNRLDDYEEGTFTPVVTAASGNNHVHFVKAGFYTKVGNIVTCDCHWVHYQQNASSGNVTITGFPFVSGDWADHTPVFNWGYCTSAAISAGSSFMGYMGRNSSYVTMFTWDATGGGTNTQFSEIPSYVTMAFAGTYQTNT